MDHLQSYSENEDYMKFSLLSERLLTLTQSRIRDKQLLNTYFKNINELDYKKFSIKDNNATMLLVNHLCSFIQPSEVFLVKGCAQFLVNIMKRETVLQGRTFIACKRWLLECLEFSEPDAAIDILAALEVLFITGKYDNIAQDLRKLLGGHSIILKFIYPKNTDWNEEQYLAVCCLKAILIKKKQNDNSITEEFSSIFKAISLQILNRLLHEDINNFYTNKMACECIRILRNILPDGTILSNTEVIGEMLGIVQAYLFLGIKGYSKISPQILRPSIMNLPDITHPVQRRKYFRNHKTKKKKQTSKKTDSKANAPAEVKLAIRYSSDSETSDTENKNKTHSDANVRLQVIHLLDDLIYCSSKREIFGYWTQIVASGSISNTRVLTQYILREPVTKVRQSALTTLNDLLTSAKIFLSHAEDVEQMSFVTFFGMLSSVIKELHYTLSLIISSERNVVILTQALKSATSLAQGTPYSKLKPGLATKLARHCKSHLFNKDPTVRVAALSVFETLALSEPITPEIYNILSKASNVSSDNDMESINSGFNTANETETEEIVIDDFEENIDQADFVENDNSQQTHMSAIVQVCLKNIANVLANDPVRLQSLKLLGTLAFNTSILIFFHMETILETLIDVTKESEPQIAFQACRVLEVMAGRLADTKSDDILRFWNIAFNPIISLMQHTQFILREVACDCLGNIGDEMFAQLSRDKSIMIITVLFGAARDEECAVRAAALRALGLLACLSTLEEDTGFLMDLIDATCLAVEDSNLGVRVKAVWSLASLSDCLVKREKNPEVEPVPLKLTLPKLYNTSIKVVQDHEKVKCNAVRVIGNVISLCYDKSILEDTSSGLNALVSCAGTGNDVKVRWNACRAIGIILSRNPNNILPPNWEDAVYPALCDLICNNQNFKVRTNAAWALSMCNSYDKYMVTLWKSLILALENSQHVPSYIEYPHRDALVQQLCIALCHIAVHTEISDLEAIWAEVKDHFDDLSHHIKHFQEHVLPEKAGDLVKAKAKFALFAQQSTKSNVKQHATKLLELFRKDDRYDKFDALSVLS